MSVQRPDGRQGIAPLATRSIASLLEGLSSPELERLAVDVILQNRRYLEQAQSLFDRLEGAEVEGCGELDDLRHDYHLALITLTGHHQIVAALIETLGYVPEVPGNDLQDQAVAGLN